MSGDIGGVGARASKAVGSMNTENLSPTRTASLTQHNSGYLNSTIVNTVLDA